MDIVEKLIVMRDIGCSTQSDRDLLADAANEITRLRKVEAAAKTLSLQMRDDILSRQST